MPLPARVVINDPFVAAAMRVAFVLLLLASVALAGCATDDPEDSGQTGTVGFAVTDAPTDEFAKVEVTFSRVAIHRSGGGSSDGNASTSVSLTNSSTATGTGTSTSTLTTAPGNLSLSGSVSATASVGATSSGPASEAGWVTIVSSPRTVDLIALHKNNTAETLGFADVAAGHYQQVRFSVDRVVGTRTDGTVENMTVPSGVIRTSGSFTVVAGGNTTLTVEIDLDRSISCNEARAGGAGAGANARGGCRFQPHIGRVEARET